MKTGEASAVEGQILRLEERAGKIRSLLKYASRAFVLEFAGTPKSGKSTSVEAIRHFFNRNGFRVHVLTERAAVCPIPMKGHLFFNTWCASSMLAELLANVETETDIIIVDRGLVDALVWLVLQEKRSEVTSEEARTIESFLLLERWRSLTDIAVVMTVDPKEAIARENSQRISNKPGSIMNETVLDTIAKAVDLVTERFGSKFGAIIKHNTDGSDTKRSLINLADQVLSSFEAFLNPEILVVPKVQIENLPLVQGGNFDPSALADAQEIIRSCGFFVHRDQAELDDNVVQIIPCGVLDYQNQVFLFRRKDRDAKSHLFGTLTIWQGCHVQKQSGLRLDNLLEHSLLERISQSLFLSRVFPLRLIGYCWDPKKSHSSRHFGMVYQVRINNDHTATDLQKKEFRTQRGYGKGGQFVEWSELGKPDVVSSLESWSLAISKGWIRLDE